ncbi:unnamed protein product, partial [marine sediment metagenome]
MLSAALTAVPAKGNEEMKYGIGDWPEKLGNHRALV